MKKNLLAALTVLTLFSSCYHMPTDDDECLVPMTNNPAVTRERPQGPLPGLNY